MILYHYTVVSPAVTQSGQCLRMVVFLFIDVCMYVYVCMLRDETSTQNICFSILYAHL
jgi:hypothetical protein